MLKLAALENVYSTHSMAVGLCGVTTKHILKEREDGEHFIFPDLDRILALATPDPKTLDSYVANARWLLKQEFTRPYVAMLEDHCIQIRIQECNAVKSAIHRVGTVLAVLYKWKRSD